MYRGRGGGGRGGGGRGGGYRGGGRGGRGGGGGGRGAYYKAKYGGRGRGGGGGSPSHEDFRPAKQARPSQPAEALRTILMRVNGKPYPAYKDMYGSYLFGGGGAAQFTLHVDRVQGDAYAAPSWFRIEMPHAVAGFPPELYSNAVRRRALADFLARNFYRLTKERGISHRRDSGGWSGVKGGDLVMAEPSQHVLQRTNVAVSEHGIQARFTVGLPARGRTIVGDMAWQLLGEHTPDMTRLSFVYASLDAAAVRAHVLCVEDQHALRASLSSLGLIGFVRNGSILPRASGADDRPLPSGAVPFASPPGLQVEVTVPNGPPMKGMGIKPGVTLIVGGGYHGKSTLLQALEVGMYDKLPGDGREFVCLDPAAVKIRAEDGRQVSAVGIHGFISNLPGGKDTTSFSTPDASGSTSQAASIVEALEVGATTLLIDEDTAATNFMIRDERMTMLVSAEKEPITPYISRVRELFDASGVSSVLVIGGCGAYFEVADTVIQMDSYVPADVTGKAKAIVAETMAGGGVAVPARPFPVVPRRAPVAASFATNAKVATRSQTIVNFGDAVLDLTGVEQLVEVGQTRVIADLISRAPLARFLAPGKPLGAVLDDLEAQFDTIGLDAVLPDSYFFGFTRPRRFEIAAALNRYRGGTFTQV